MAGSNMFLVAMFAVVLLSLLSISEARPSQNFAGLKERRSNKGQMNFNGYNVPLSDGTSSLPSPTGSLKAIALGRGTQNYTCNPISTTNSSSSSSSSPTPISNGAQADLLDASALLQYVNPSEGQNILSILPSYLIEFDLAVLSKYSIPLLGKHYFNAGLQPVFDLGSTGFLTAKKVASIPAPPGAHAGQPGQAYGAVDWLNLADAGGSRGVSSVYRIVTAGGKAPASCSTDGKPITIQYAAEYWFYG